MDLDARILVTGQCGWVGNAVRRRLWAAGLHNIRFLAPDEINLARPASVDALLFRDRPEYVFLTSAREGAGGRSDEAVRESLAVQANVIHAAWRADVRKVCFLASSSIYPAGALPPLRDGTLLSAAVEPGQGGEVLAQVAGVVHDDPRGVGGAHVEPVEGLDERGPTLDRGGCLAARERDRDMLPFVGQRLAGGRGQEHVTDLEQLRTLDAM